MLSTHNVYAFEERASEVENAFKAIILNSFNVGDVYNLSANAVAEFGKTRVEEFWYD